MPRVPVLVLVVLLLLAIGVGAGRLLSSPAQNAPMPNTTTSSVAESDPPSTEPAPSAQAAPTCWDGSSPVDTGCSVPTGEAGLRWVFPSIATQQQCTTDSIPRADKSTAINCRVTTADGPATLTYSEYLDWDQMLSHYTTINQGRMPTESDGLLIYAPIAKPSGEPGFRTSLHYSEPLKFAVTAGALSREAASAALDTVRPRPERRFQLD